MGNCHELLGNVGLCWDNLPKMGSKSCPANILEPADVDANLAMGSTQQTVPRETYEKNGLRLESSLESIESP